MNEKNTVDLYTALVLIESLGDDRNLVFLKKQGNGLLPNPDEILTVKQVKEKYDMRRTRVTRIVPYFCCEDYEGLLLFITDGRNS